MRSLLSTLLLACALAGGCAKKQSKETTPPPAAPAPAADGAGSAAPPQQGIALGEPHPSGAAPAAGARPAVVTDADIALVEKLLAVMTKMADNVGKAGSDCQAAAAAIRAVTPEVQAIGLEVKKMDEHLKTDPNAEKWFEAVYGERVNASLAPMATSACMQDPAVSQAMQSLNF